jgi:23S rRNA (cytidine1920-2'-O)/16S rRNA (cytidine1409-2'-O)-methyltransferase
MCRKSLSNERRGFRYGCVTTSLLSIDISAGCASFERVAKVRLDQLLVQRQLVESRERAQRLIMAGEVLVNNRVVDKPGMSIAADAAIRIKEPLPYVSRGGLKLAAALDRFPIPIEHVTCADVGASTGGFTDCLRSAARRVCMPST